VRSRCSPGIDAPYEPPESPELRVPTTRMSVEEAVEELLGQLGSLD
jgi:adenylylsulfate kinase-like enzyme